MSLPILVGVALRDDDTAPVALGRELAGFMTAPLSLAHVPPGEPPSRIPVLAYDTDRRERALARVQELADPIGAIAHVVTASSPVAGLHEAAATLDAAVLVVGSSHRGALGRIMPGGVGERDWWNRRGVLSPYPFLTSWQGRVQRSPVKAVRAWRSAHCCPTGWTPRSR